MVRKRLKGETAKAEKAERKYKWKGEKLSHMREREGEGEWREVGREEEALTEGESRLLAKLQWAHWRTPCCQLVSLWQTADLPLGGLLKHTHTDVTTNKIRHTFKSSHIHNCGDRYRHLCMYILKNMNTCNCAKADTQIVWNAKRDKTYA